MGSRVLTGSAADYRDRQKLVGSGGGTAHVCGTLRCGVDDSSSVVDGSGRVHGMSGLYVVDGSVLARSSRVNPSLTIYAWGLRVGDLLARQFVGEQVGSVAAEEVVHAS